MQTGNELSEIKLQALFFIIFSGRGELQVGADKGQNTARATGKRKRKGNILHMVKGRLLGLVRGFSGCCQPAKAKIVLTSSLANKQAGVQKKGPSFGTGERQMRKRSKPKRTLFAAAPIGGGLGLGWSWADLRRASTIHPPPT